MERTFILFKPDCVQRRLVGRILKRFEDKGLNIVAMKMLRITPELAKQHYAEHVEKAWYPTLEGFITSGPVVAAVLEGLEAIRVVREMLGATSGLKATPGTIRGDFSSSRQMNLVHGSDGPEAAEPRDRAVLQDERDLRLRADDRQVAAGGRRELSIANWPMPLHCIGCAAICIRSAADPAPGRSGESCGRASTARSPESSPSCSCSTPWR